MRRILIVIAALVLVGAGLVFIAPLFLSTENLQKKALAQVESATGYRVRVDGPVKISVFPSLDLVARDVGIAQADEGGAAEFATARALRFGLVLRSLLAGKVNLTEVTLVDPVITLPLADKPAPRTAAPAEEEKSARQDLSIHELTIRNGTVILPGENGAPGKQITALNGEAALPRANGPLTFDAKARYDNDPVAVKGTIGSFGHFLEGGPVPVTLALDTPDLPDGATLKGAASYKDDVLTVSQFQAKSGAHEISGNATYRDDTLTIGQGVFDGTPFAGTAHLAGETLTVDAEVAVEGKPARLTGSLGAFDQFLAGSAAPIKLAVVAPEHLKDQVTLSGLVAYKDDTITLPNFTAVSGADTVSGAAVYKDDALFLTQATAKIGDQTISGDAAYRNDAVELDVTVDPGGKPAKVTGSIAGIEKLLGGEPVPIKLEIESERLPAKTSVAGGAFYQNDTLVLTAFTAVSGDYALTGDGIYKDDILTLDPIKIETGSQIVSGALTANLAGDVPNVTGTLVATGAVSSKGGAPPSREPPQDVAPAAETKPAPAPEPAANPLAQPPGGTEVAVAPPPTELEEKAPAAKPAKSAKPGSRTSGVGWRAEKLGLLALKDVNADVTLTLNQFAFEGVHVGSATLNVALAGGKLTAATQDLKAYGGGGTMTLVLDASGAAPAHRLSLVATGLDAYPFLNDVADFTTIEGKAALALDLTASGNSERAMVSSLNGTAKFEFTDGALRGLNVANMLRNLTTGVLTGWQYKREAKTAFNKFSASFAIAKGQAQTDDLRLLGPLVSVGGAGTVDIPSQRLKFRVNPFMLASVESQNGKNNMLGFPVPIAVSGPWDNPSIYPDIVGVLESPVAAYQQLNKLGGGLISMPTDLLGIDTGKGGLVEKSIALPQAVTKGVVGGIGQVLGVKKKDAPAEGQAAPAEDAPAPSALGQPAEQPPAAEAPPQQQAAPTQEAAPKQEPAPKQDTAPGFGGTFGN